MTRQHNSMIAWKAVVFSLALSPVVVTAQTASVDTAPDWRGANETVGAYRRGHVDVLKWEAANRSPEGGDSQPAARGLALNTLEALTRQVWRTHFDLANQLSILGAANVDRLETGRWTEIDPAVRRRVEELDEILEVAVQARKAWLRATSARQEVAHFRAALDAADAASNLGQRMVQTGNWSKLKQTQVQLTQSLARTNLIRAQYTANQAQFELIDLLKLKDQYSHLLLPDSLPDVPEQLVPPLAWQQRASATQAQLPSAEARHNRANMERALAAYQLTHELVTIARNDVLKVREFIGEETVLHYNGMLASVWDLLDESRNQSQAAIDAIRAQRDFWLADADLQWVSLGGEPENFVSLDGGGESATPAGH